MISPVRADVQSGWLSSANPSIKLTADLAPNTSPGLSNRDCTPETYNAVNPQTGAISTASDCLADSTLGQMDLFGSPVIFGGTGQAVQIIPDYPYVLQPIPNQGMMLALNSAQVTGSYLHFYTDIRQDLTPNYVDRIGSLASYSINKPPDVDLRDKNNALIAANAVGTMSYSSDGSWMVVDSPGGSFLRVNLATFDILPFAQSLNGVGDYANRLAATAISDDGKYAAVASFDYSYLRVYDLTTCAGTTNANYSQQLDCQYRDYRPTLNSSYNNFHAIYSVRFVNDDNISLTASNNWQSGASYSVSKFTLTAPGKFAHSLDYLALGDSYISGEGEFQYKAGTDTDNDKCHQSPLSYPFIVGADLFNQYNSIACSGAVVKDITNQQDGYKGQVKDNVIAKNRNQTQILADFSPGYLSQINFVTKYQPSAVTLSIGGNNVGFANIVTKCVEQALPRGTLKKDCYNTYEDRARLVKAIDATYGDLLKTYTQIMKADPGVRLYVVGYPQVIARGSCGENVQLTDVDIDFAQRLIDYLDTTIQQAADAAGARYVDVQDALDGHRLCEASSNQIAVNGVTAGDDNGPFGTKVIGDESFHPNVLGHQLLAHAILNQTNNFKQAMPAPNPNIQPPTANDPIAIAFLNNYPPRSGFVLPATVAVADEVSSTTTRGAALNATFSPSKYGLALNTNYQVNLISSSGAVTRLGSYKTDSTGTLQVAATIPNSIEVGFQTLSVEGLNIAGQTMGLYADIYVGASASDMNGDGIPDNQQSCFLIPSSGLDVDSDGIDDACDPVIGDKPTQTYPVTVRLTGNAIYVGN